MIIPLGEAYENFFRFIGWLLSIFLYRFCRSRWLCRSDHIRRLGRSKTQVINFIKKNVDTAYCKGLGQCSATLLRMMEEAQLKSFKNLAKTAREHQKEYKQVYKDYCVGIGQCDYSTLEMMFKEEVKNASKQLTW